MVSKKIVYICENVLRFYIARPFCVIVNSLITNKPISNKKWNNMSVIDYRTLKKVLQFKMTLKFIYEKTTFILIIKKCIFLHFRKVK
jgi:hypothetical protein